MSLSGSKEFIDNLLVHPFQSPCGILEVMNGCDVSGHALLTCGFRNPILVPNKDGLRIRVPASFTPSDLLNYIDPEMVVDVIDVRAQIEVQMPLKEFVDHFTASKRTKLLNMLSLEFSRTSLAERVEPPHVVSELSLISNCWITDPSDDADDEPTDSLGSTFSIPSVQKYCLLSMAGSYTDFHIDFGGSSVWYHVVWGEKIFYLAFPSAENLSAYWKWFWNPNRRAIFFPDLLRKLDVNSDCSPVYQVRVHAGHTILLPAGWIHAVYTVSDCLVFGGNFLNEIHIPMQLSVYRMEQKSGTPRKFQFPNFEKLHWFVADRIAGRLTNLLHDHREPALHELKAACCLAKVLPHWLERRRGLPAHERSYFLPSQATLELPWVQLIDRLHELVLAFAPNARDLFESTSYSAGSRTVRLQMPGGTISGHRGKPIVRQLHGATSTSRRFTTSNQGTTHVKEKSSPSSTMCTSFDPCRVGSPRLCKRLNPKYRPAGDSSTSLVTDDPEILHALPELATSNLIDDHYFLSLSDSEDETSHSRVFKRQRPAASTRKSRDPDPTWSQPRPTHRKPGSSLLSSCPYKEGLSNLALTSGVLHPLLCDSSKTSMQANSSLSGKRLAGRTSQLLPTAHQRPKSKGKGATTARQRLAKRLGL